MSTAFEPPRRLLLDPGPSDAHPRVLEALSKPLIGHLDPAFLALMDEVKDLLRRVFRTRNDLTFAVSGTGSAGMETCLVNLLEEGASFSPRSAPARTRRAFADVFSTSSRSRSATASALSKARSGESA